MLVSMPVKCALFYIHVIKINNRISLRSLFYGKVRNCCLLKAFEIFIFHWLIAFLAFFALKLLSQILILLDQAKIELITTFLGRNCRMGLMKGACLQIQKSANIIYVAGAFQRNRESKKYIQGVKNGEPIFSHITVNTVLLYIIILFC